MRRVADDLVFDRDLLGRIFFDSLVEQRCENVISFASVGAKLDQGVCLGGNDIVPISADKCELDNLKALLREKVGTLRAASPFFVGAKHTGGVDLVSLDELDDSDLDLDLPLDEQTDPNGDF